MANSKYIDNQGVEYIITDNDEINRGGEGIIYKIQKSNNEVAKIYHTNKINFTKTKFDYLQQLDKNTFVIPEKILYNNNKIAGYIMKYVSADYQPVSSFFNQAFCIKHNIDEKTKLKIAENLIRAMQQAHNKSIIIGDFNQFNILVKTTGEIQIIDTDSYETPGESHSGTLLEEIRDYLYPGKPTKESDFFALAVIIFYLFTHTHPFKGIHSVHKNLKERIIHKISVLSKNPDLKTPKCYRPVSQKNLSEQFERIFDKGERFLISIDTKSTSIVLPIKIQKNISQEKDIFIKNIVENEIIINSYFCENIGYFETQNSFTILKTSQKSYFERLGVIAKTQADEIFTGKRNIIIRKSEKLYHYKSSKNQTELNFKIPQQSETHILGNTIINIDSENMYIIYIDEIINNSIKNDRISVSGRSFSRHNGLFQNIGGKRRIFFNTGKNIASVTSSKNIKAIMQTGIAGIISEIDTDRLIHRFYIADGLTVKYSDELQNNSHIAYMPLDSRNGFIFEPSDNKISIYRTEDFEKISELNCSIIHEQTKLYYTKSGIVAINEDSAFLLNTK